MDSGRRFAHPMLAGSHAHRSEDHLRVFLARWNGICCYLFLCLLFSASRWMIFLWLIQFARCECAVHTSGYYNFSIGKSTVTNSN